MSRKKRKPDMQATEASTFVPNPLREIVPQLRVIERELTYVEDRVQATVTLRDDPLGHMRYRGEAGKRLGESQYQAGRKWQVIYEDAGVGRVRSSGDLREPVDCGGIVSDGITDRQMRAHKSLAHFRTILGREGAVLVEAILADKCTLRMMAMRLHGEASAANIKYVGRRFRECLSTLARDMGLA